MMHSSDRILSNPTLTKSNGRQTALMQNLPSGHSRLIPLLRMRAQICRLVILNPLFFVDYAASRSLLACSHFIFRSENDLLSGMCCSWRVSLLYWILIFWLDFLQFGTCLSQRCKDRRFGRMYRCRGCWNSEWRTKGVIIILVWIDSYRSLSFSLQDSKIQMTIRSQFKGKTLLTIARESSST